MGKGNIFRTDSIASATANAHLESGTLLEVEDLVKDLKAHPFAGILAETEAAGYFRIAIDHA